MITPSQITSGAAGGRGVEGLEGRVLLAAVVLNDLTGLTLAESYEGILRVGDVDGGFEVGGTSADELGRRVPMTIEFSDVTTDRREVGGTIDAGELGTFEFEGTVSRRRLSLELLGEEDASGVLTARLAGGGNLLRGDVVLADGDGDELEGRVVTRDADAVTGGGRGLDRFGLGVNNDALRRFGFGNSVDMDAARRFGFGSGVGVSSPIFSGRAVTDGVGDTTSAIVTRDDGLFNTTFNGSQIGSVFDF